VSGSDQADSPYIARLRERGITVTVPHARSAVPADAEIVYSSAVPTDNVERQRAEELGLRQRPRGDLLAELVSDRHYIAVVGTHGKTTTAAMILHCLQAADPRAGYIIGGDLLTNWLQRPLENEGTWLVIKPMSRTARPCS